MSSKGLQYCSAWWAIVAIVKTKDQLGGLERGASRSLLRGGSGEPGAASLSHVGGG